MWFELYCRICKVWVCGSVSVVMLLSVLSIYLIVLFMLCLVIRWFVLLYLKFMMLGVMLSVILVGVGVCLIFIVWLFLLCLKWVILVGVCWIFRLFIWLCLKWIVWIGWFVLVLLIGVFMMLSVSNLLVFLYLNCCFMLFGCVLVKSWLLVLYVNV